jgi:2-C-methyl-D-erythritol 2,4-cyclodiphosphate synthase
MDAVLGALCLGDIGTHFPDTDPRYKGCDSRVLLAEVVVMMMTHGYRLANADVTIVAQAPKMAPYLRSMRDHLARDLQILLEQINIKATTTEYLGFVGRGEGISCHAVVLIEPV